MFEVGKPDRCFASVTGCDELRKPERQQWTTLRTSTRASRLLLRRVSLLPVGEDDADQQYIELIVLASDYRAVPSGASRTNHTWEICHLARPIPGVESEGRRESVAGAPRKCGFDDAAALARRKIRVWRGTVCLVCVVCERDWF